MSYSSSWKMPDIDKAVKQDFGDIARAHTRGMLETVNGFKEEFREQIVGAGLGDRLAKTVRSKVYPDRAGKLSTEPTGIVYVNPGSNRRGSAPRIIQHFVSGADITPAFGNALAIPTPFTPKTGASRGGKRPMTPVEVEAKFDAELFPRRLKSGNIGLFINVIRGLSTRRPGFRPNTKNRRSQGREAQAVWMFTLVRHVKGKKILSPDRLFDKWAARLPGLIDEQRRFSKR